MARKQETSKKVEMRNKKPSASRQGRLRLINKSGVNSFDADALLSEDTKADASTIESPEQKSCFSPEDLDRRIAIRAYELFQRRGGHHGLDREDWFEAKRQVAAGEP